MIALQLPVNDGTAMDKIWWATRDVIYSTNILEQRPSAITLNKSARDWREFLQYNAL